MAWATKLVRQVLSMPCGRRRRAERCLRQETPHNEKPAHRQRAARSLQRGLITARNKLRGYHAACSPGLPTLGQPGLLTVSHGLFLQGARSHTAYPLRRASPALIAAGTTPQRSLRDSRSLDCPLSKGVPPLPPPMYPLSSLPRAHRHLQLSLVPASLILVAGTFLRG